MGTERLDVVEGSFPAEAKEGMSRAHPLENKMILVCLNWLSPDQGTAWDEWN
jgi:hypothetical protein